MGVARYSRDEKDRITEVEYLSGIKVKPVYGPEDLKASGFEYEKDLNAPGEYPFTRGIHPQGYRSRKWTMRQYSGFGSPEQSNERFKLLIANGQNGLNVAFDLPSQMGLDSDDPMAEGEVGRVGMAVDSLKDFEIAFKDIALDRIGTGLTINAVASIMQAMYQAVAEKYGFSKQVISATPQNDILKEIIGRGAWIYPPAAGVKLIGDTIEYSVREMPRANPVSICGYHIRESGATPAQEIAYAIQIANTYIEEVLPRGLEIDDFVGRFSFNINIYGNLWETVAKFRAARKMWARNLKERYGAGKKNKKVLFFRGLFGGGGSGLTKQQPMNNIVRGAYYGLAAALGGAQTTALCSYDEAYTIPTPQSALLSLRTLQIIMEEVGLRDTVDPLAGSYFIETITKEMEDLIVKEMAEIDAYGGMLKAVEDGYVQRKVARQEYEFQKGLEKGDYVKVGVNKYVTDEEDEQAVELHEYDEAGAAAKIAGLRELRRSRDGRAVVRCLKELEATARKGGNVMPPLVECCRNYATVGEMAGVFKEIYGEFKEPGIF
jgi:methylmalonyl-CoA mutase N-terminal domain/subunit